MDTAAIALLIEKAATVAKIAYDNREVAFRAFEHIRFLASSLFSGTPITEEKGAEIEADLDAGLAEFNGLKRPT